MIARGTEESVGCVMLKVGFVVSQSAGGIFHSVELMAREVCRIEVRDMGSWMMMAGPVW